jgi:predicted phosphodiesterase
MRIAVLSDIHANLPALQAVLGALKPYDAIWQLGDIVGYGPQPNEVVALLAAEGAIGGRGNHDARLQPACRLNFCEVHGDANVSFCQCGHDI